MVTDTELFLVHRKMIAPLNLSQTSPVGVQFQNQTSYYMYVTYEETNGPKLLKVACA